MASLTTSISLKNVYSGGSSHQFEDLSVDMLVGEFKTLVQDRLKDHPPPEAQRLIHCGKICDDGSTLGSYVSKRQNEATFDGTPHTFHLVLSSTTTQLQRTMSEPPKPTAAQRRAAEAAAATSATSASSVRAPPPEPSPMGRSVTSPVLPSEPSSSPVVSRSEARAAAVAAAEIRKKRLQAQLGEPASPSATTSPTSTATQAAGTAAELAPQSAPARLSSNVTSFSPAWSSPPPPAPLHFGGGGGGPGAEVARRVSFSDDANDGDSHPPPPPSSWFSASPAPPNAVDTAEASAAAAAAASYDRAYAQAVGGEGASATQRNFSLLMHSQQQAEAQQLYAVEGEVALMRQFADALFAWRLAHSGGNGGYPNSPSYPFPPHPWHPSQCSPHQYKTQQHYTQEQHQQNQQQPNAFVTRTEAAASAAAAQEYASQGYATSAETAAAAAMYHQHHHQLTPQHQNGYQQSAMSPGAPSFAPQPGVAASPFVAPLLPPPPAIQHHGYGPPHFLHQDDNLQAPLLQQPLLPLPPQPPQQQQQQQQQQQPLQPAQAPPQLVPPPVPQQPVALQRRLVFAFFLNNDDLKLAMKLAVVVMLLGQNASPRKLATLTFAAVAAFVWQTVAAHRERNRINNNNNNRVRNPNPDLNRNNNNNGGEQAQQNDNVGNEAANDVGNNGDNEDDDDDDEAERPLPPLRVRGLAEGGIAPGGGIGMDLTYLVLSFVCSLVPAWSPKPAVDEDEVNRRRTLEMHRAQLRTARENAFREDGDDNDEDEEGESESESESADSEAVENE